MFYNIRRKTYFLILLLSACFISTQAHSWLACVDYTEKNAGTYDDARCRGYARNAKTHAPNGGEFGQDRGALFVWFQIDMTIIGYYNGMYRSTGYKYPVERSALAIPFTTVTRDRPNTLHEVNKLYLNSIFRFRLPSKWNKSLQRRTKRWPVLWRQSSESRLLSGSTSGVGSPDEGNLFF